MFNFSRIREFQIEREIMCFFLIPLDYIKKKSVLVRLQGYEHYTLLVEMWIENFL